MKLGQLWGWIKGSPVRLALLAVCTLLLVVVLIPTVLDWAPHWFTSTSGLKPAQRATEVDASRTALLALLAGAIAVVGAIYTGRTFALNRQPTSTRERPIDEAMNC